MRATDVSFRAVEIQVNGESVTGFALWYKDSDAARMFFEMIREYFEERHAESKEVRMEFSREAGASSGTFGLFLEIRVGSRSFVTRIAGIAEEHVLAVTCTLDRYPYTFVLTGYTDLAGNDHVLHDCYYCSTSVLVDGTMMTGRGEKPFPTNALRELVRSEGG